MMKSTSDRSELEECTAKVFKALSSPVRLRMLGLIAEKGQYCGCLVEALGLAQSTVSHHLKILTEAGLISGMEEGPATCYSVNWDRCRELCEVVSSILKAKGGESQPETVEPTSVGPSSHI